MTLRRNRSVARTLSIRIQGVLIVGMVFLVVAIFVSERIRAPWITDLRGVLLEVSSPATQIFSPLLSLRAGTFLSDIRDVPRLVAVNESLRAENTRLSGWFSEAVRLEAENRALRALLQVPQAGAPEGVTARVLGDTGDTFARSVLVSAGQRDGVQVGFIASNSGGLVGRVVESGGHTARVLLLSDINSRLPVYVGKDRHEAILAGNNSDSPQLMYAQESEQLRTGQVVFTSGSGGAFTPMLKVGVVEQSAEGLWQVQLFASAHDDLFLLLAPSTPTLSSDTINGLASDTQANGVLTSDTQANGVLINGGASHTDNAGR